MRPRALAEEGSYNPELMEERWVEAFSLIERASKLWFRGSR